MLEELQERLLVVLQRTLSLAVGRGFLLLGTSRPTVTQSIDIPDLSITGASKHATASNVVLKDPTTISLCWPQFHNGVAAALAVEHREAQQHASSWLAFHQFDAA